MLSTISWVGFSYFAIGLLLAMRVQLTDRALQIVRQDTKALMSRYKWLDSEDPITDNQIMIIWRIVVFFLWALLFAKGTKVGSFGLHQFDIDTFYWTVDMERKDKQ